MMFRIKKIDKYLFKKYLKTFFFTCLLFSLIAVVIEISQKLENLLKTDVSLDRIFTEYLLLFIPWINGLLWPLFALISVIFFTSRLARDTEFIAMLSTGMSLRRLVMPYLTAAVIISGLHYLLSHHIIPLSNDQRLSFEYTYIRPDRVEGRTQDVHFFLNPQQKIYIRFYSRSDTLCRDVRIETFGESNELVEVLRARTMRILEPPNKWRITDYEIRNLREGEMSYKVFRGKNMDTVLNLLPEDFITYAKERDMMTTPQLHAFLEREASKGVGRSPLVVAEYHRRTADPVSIIILTVIGFALASRKVRGGVGIHLAAGVLLGALFVFMSKFSITYATNPNTNTLFAIWLPNILFSIIALILLKNAQK
ncbi:MAG: YjgP/YjgQ family permease [Saprospirales bacterium]|nr:MAG: YjgP/YjgQ family permease [Saprospirales bacterium]